MLNEIHKKVKSLLAEKGHRLTNGEPLVTSGLLSSLKIVELASWLEKNYDIDFSENFNVYDFESVDTIMELINRKK